jgi:ABC-type Na+ efflux pump permease subunit
MRKVLTIARREYFAMVATRAFLFSIAMMPILMFGEIIAAGALSNVADVEDKTIVVYDETGELFEKLRESARTRNESIDRSRSQSQSVDDGENAADLASEPKYILQEKAVEQLTDESRWELSEQIRSGEINAWC